MINRFKELADSCDEKIGSLFKKILKPTQKTSERNSTPLAHYFLSDVGQALWDSLGNPDDWEYGRSGSKYTIVHKHSGIALWIANGSWFLDGYDELVIYPSPPKVQIGKFERHILWRRVSSLKKTWAKDAFSEVNKTNKKSVDMLRKNNV